MKISVLIFFLNEEGNLPLLRERIESVQRSENAQYEVILVDDGSTDHSTAICEEWVEASESVTLVRLSRNFGSHAAIAAGLEHCTGECAVIMAADLQDPPELIPVLTAEHQKGVDVVWACRSERRGESWFTTTSAAIYYRMMRSLGLPSMPPKGADFLLVSRKVVEAVNRHPEKHTSILAMILWMGFRQTSIDYVKQARHAGKSKWTLSKKIKLAVDSIVSFSYLPIRLAAVLGLLLAGLGVVATVVLLILWLTGYVVKGTGYAAIMCTLMVGQGMILFSLGVLGEYLWRTFDESRGRPRYIVDTIKRAGRSGKTSQH